MNALPPNETHRPARATFIARGAAWLALALLAVSAQPSRAEETQSSAAPDEAERTEDAAEPDGLTGDWGGLRTQLRAHGIELGVSYIGETLGNPAGGTRRGAIYEGRLEMGVDIDLEKAVHWDGALIHANAYQIHGRGLSARDLGNNFLIASGIEATPSSRLFDLWFQQAMFDRMLSVRAGQIAADDEFFISAYAANFINSTFGWPGILAADLPSGGPAYPLATPGVRITLAPSESLSVSAAIFDGDPAGPGQGDPQQRNSSGTNFRTSDAPFSIAEIVYRVAPSKDGTTLPAAYKLGGWYHAGRFDDLRVDDTSRLLADPASTGRARSHRGNYGAYVVVDQMLWQRPGSDDEGLGAFLRVSGSPADRNVIDLYADGGLTFKGLLPNRPDDVIGLGVAFARVSSAARNADSDSNAFNGADAPRRNYETAIELTYKLQLTPWWTVQPDAQFIIHPAGNAANPASASGTEPIPNAFVLGVRSTVRF